MRASFTLPYPPSVNTYWRQFNGRTILSQAGRDYKVEVLAVIVNERIPKFGESRLAVKLVLRPRDKRRRDLDNSIKSVLDALENSGVFVNDFQVDYLEIRRGEPITGGAIHVTIETIEGDDK